MKTYIVTYQYDDGDVNTGIRNTVITLNDLTRLDDAGILYKIRWAVSNKDDDIFVISKVIILSMCQL